MSGWALLDDFYFFCHFGNFFRCARWSWRCQLPQKKSHQLCLIGTKICQRRQSPQCLMLVWPVGQKGKCGNWFQLGCLCVFVHLRAYVMGEGDFAGEKVTVWVRVVRIASLLLYFGKDGTIKGSALFCYVLFFDNVVYDDPSHILCHRNQAAVCIF